MSYFIKCPRCGNDDWNSSISTLCTRGIYVSYYNSKRNLLDLNIDNICGYNIMWMITEQQCYIHPYNSNDDYIKVPWIPFDVSEEQFKLYLTFS